MPSGWATGSVSHGAQSQWLVLEEMKSQEGLPVAILEAMAHALRGCYRMARRPRRHGGHGRPNRGAARNPERRRALGWEGWRRAQEHFSWEQKRCSLLNVLGLA